MCALGMEQFLYHQHTDFCNWFVIFYLITSSLWFIILYAEGMWNLASTVKILRWFLTPAAWTRTNTIVHKMIMYICTEMNMTKQLGKMIKKVYFFQIVKTRENVTVKQDIEGNTNYDFYERQGVSNGIRESFWMWCMYWHICG